MKEKHFHTPLFTAVPQTSPRYAMGASMKLRRITAILLTAAIIVTGAAGCGSKQSDSKGVKNVAMGRYVEEEIKMPDAVSKAEEVAYLMTKNPEGNIEVYASPMEEEQKEFIKYTLQKDGTWKRELPKWLNQKQKNSLSVMSVAYGPDGNQYAAMSNFTGDKVQVQILKSKEGNKAEEIPIEEYKDKVGYEKLPYGMSVLRGNKILLLTQEEGSLYENGKAVSHFEYSGMGYALSENSLLSLNKKGDGFLLTDVTTGKTIREVPFDGNINKAALTADKKGNWYLATGSGIYHLAKNGTTWESIMDGNLVSMSSPSLSLNGILAGDKEDFYAMYESGGMGTRTIMHYTYKKDIATTPGKTLTVISLEENYTVRQAMVDFQHKNPDVKVDYKAVMGEEDGTTVSDHIKSINTELLAGKGPDILLLDGLPIESYIEKGVLFDMGDILRPIAESGELLGNVLKNYEKENKIYYAPLRFALTFAYGKKEAVDSTATLKDLCNYAKNNPKLPLLGAELYSDSELTELLYQLYSNEFTKENGEFQEEGLKQFLEQLKVIRNQTKAMEKTGAQSEEDSGLNLETSQLLFDKKAALGLTKVDSMYNLFAPLEVLKIIKGSYATVNQEYIPQGFVGINAAGGQKEIAKEFVKALYSEEVQKIDIVGEGFPVNGKALAEFDLAKDDYWIGMSGFEAEQPSVEKMKEILELGKNVEKPVTVDKQLLTMVMAETRPYLKGDTDLTTTVSKIMEKTKAYLEE